MNFVGFSESVLQALIIRVAFEALSAIMAVLLCLALLAFAIYMIGVFLLCCVEDKPGE